MSPKGYILSPDDYQEFKELVSLRRRGLLTVPSRSKEQVVLPTGAVMLVYTPTDGIAGRVGTEPGKADCIPYETRWSTDLIQQVTADTVEVYNMSGMDVPGSMPVIAVRAKDGKWYVSSSTGFDGYTWVDVQTTDFTASVWDAVPFDLSVCSPGSPYLTLNLPPWADSPINGRILACSSWVSASYYVRVHPYGGTDNINGIPANQNLVDAGATYNTGGYWEFIRSKHSALGWTCSRYLSL